MFISGSKEVTLQVEVGGIMQCFVKKVFKTDSTSTPLKLYVDLELQDKLKCSLYDYYVLLSAHFNKTSKQLTYSRSVVENSHEKKFIVMCILRTKCSKPRYDIVLMDVSSIYKM
jgi:hypothetical protein